MDHGVPGLDTQIDQIYRAAVEPDQWPVFLESLSRELRVGTLHLAFRLPSSGDSGVMLTLGMDQGFVDAYRTHFHVADPWMPFLAAEKEGDVQALGNFVPDGELVRTEFYEEWMRPQGVFHGFGAFLHKSGPRQLVSSLSGFRDKSSGPFLEEELGRIRPLVPHLQRALVIHDRVQGAEMRAGAAAEALDRIVGGVILLDERGDPILTNRSADQILATHDGLFLNWDGPSASTPQQTGELRRLLSDAATTGVGQGAGAGGVMRLARPSGRPALEVVVTPVRHGASPMFTCDAAAAIFVADPDARAERSPERLSRVYGLTPMEAEVASRLVEGMSPAEIRDAFGITIHTVRGHLKQLFAKTKTHRQAELVRVLLVGLADIRLA